jgi:CheY-like chemotaxis protein
MHTLRKKILLVEDNILAQLAARRILETADFDVDVASDGASAIAQATQQRYDAILLDLGLPDMTGFDVAQQVRLFEESQGLPHVAIIALSAQEPNNILLVYKRVGINEVLTKPFTEKDMIVFEKKAS